MFYRVNVGDLSMLIHPFPIIGPDFFELAVCNRIRYLDGKLVPSPHSHDHAIVSRDSVARVVYSRVFDYLIHSINDRYKTDASEDTLKSIGVLDLFGFENLIPNSLEQLLINYANEQMQELFNKSLESLKSMFQDEGMVWDAATEFPSAQATLDMVFKKVNQSPFISLFESVISWCVV